MVRSKKVDRAVAPIVDQSVFNQVRLRDERVYWEQFYCVYANFLEVSNSALVTESRVSSAQVIR